MAEIEDTADVAVVPEGDHFVLKRLDVTGAVTEIRLQRNDVLDLARSIPQFASNSLSDLSQSARVSGMKSVAAVKLSRAMATPDALGEVILLSIEDELELKATYALDPLIATRLGELLVREGQKLIVQKGTDHGH